MFRLKNSFSMIINELRNLLGDGELTEVLEILRKNVSQSEHLHKVTSLSFRNAELKRQRDSGGVENQSYKAEQNQIVDSLQNLLDQLERQAAMASEQAATPPALLAYLSVGTPHREEQAHFVEFLRNHLRLKGVQLETLGSTNYSSRKPLIPIKQRMERMSGCVVLAMERFFCKDGYYRKGSDRQELVPEIYLTTAWTHIEAAMAYQIGLPMLILREKKVRSEGMIDMNTHDWNIYEFDPLDTKSITDGPLGQVIEGWVEEVRDFKIR